MTETSALGVRSEVTLGRELRRAVQRRLHRERRVFGRRDARGVAVDGPVDEKRIRRRPSRASPRAGAVSRSCSARGRAAVRPTRSARRRWRRGEPRRRRRRSIRATAPRIADEVEPVQPERSVGEHGLEELESSGAQVVDARHDVTGAEQRVAEVRPDEARRTGDDDPHRPLPSCSSVTSGAPG